MLLTLDSYAGAAVLGLFVARSDASVKWEEAYEPLLRKILRASTPSSSGSSTSSGGVGGRGSAVRGRYTPVPQAEMELGGIGDQSSSPS
eukprot:evm.model.NODE_25722_length_19825_cov_36.388348.2